MAIFLHVPFANISPEFASRVIVGTSPSKTFNLAGLQVSNITIPDEKLRERFRRENGAAGYSQANTLGLTACKAFYELGDRWYREPLIYLEGNLTYVREFLRRELPQIRLIEPEGTYLVWLDFGALGFAHRKLKKIIVEDARPSGEAVWLLKGPYCDVND